MDSFPLTTYLIQHSKQLLNQLFWQHLCRPKTALFLYKRASLLKKAGRLRLDYQQQGISIPTFLIASIANRCNLNCLGCYARATGICDDIPEKTPLSDTEWEDLFHQAASLGISFCLLAGGEPLLRQDVLQAACRTKEMIFPVFTNGTLFTKKTCDLFKENPHLIPIISLEGSLESTDLRRGKGIGLLVKDTMKAMKAAQLLMGVSITVTTKNMDQVFADSFLDSLADSGVRLLFLIEYVPIGEGDHQLAFTPDNRGKLLEKCLQAKKSQRRMPILTFPGDEINLGGCLAAGRGFFHINPYGDAEACPFAPYSDRNLREHSLLEVISSPFFHALRKAGLVGGEHDGGCSLFAHSQEVQAILASLDAPTTNTSEASIDK